VTTKITLLYEVNPRILLEIY